MTYQVTKRFGHELGLSCAFRQPKATHSHCSQLHGYALAIEIVFEGKTLDDKNWVIDFGGFDEVKQLIKDKFDHTTCIDKNDPHLDYFKLGAANGVLALRIMDGVGCEKFAFHVFNMVEVWLEYTGHKNRIKLVSVTVSEHGANSATYLGG